MIEYRHHGDGFACTKCGATVYRTSLAPPPGLCDMCSVAYDFRGCRTCGGGGTIDPEPCGSGTYKRACPTCQAPAGPDDERCEHVGQSLWTKKRCRLRKGHWAYCGTCSVNGHVFGDFDEDASARYRAAHRADPKEYP